MIKRIVANFFLCLGKEETPAEYDVALLEIADAPDWLSLEHWEWAFTTSDAQTIDRRIAELAERKNKLFNQIIYAEGIEVTQIEDDLSLCETESEILTCERNLLRDVVFLRTENLKLADKFWMIIKRKGDLK